MAQKYVKRPIPVEALLFTGKNTKELLIWGEGKIEAGHSCLLIHTLEGTVSCPPDTMVVKGVFGEFYPCNLEVFNKIYEVWEG